MIKHLELYLGAIDYGWSMPTSPSGVMVARFRNKPYQGAYSYVTLGMSNYQLPMSEQRTVLQEFVFFADDVFPSEPIASFLLTFSEYVLQKKQALLRGDVVGPSSPLIPGVHCNAVYAGLPVLYEDGFSRKRHPLQ